MRNYVLVCLFALMFSTCGNDESTTKDGESKAAKSEHTFFELLSADKTGVDFVNQVEDRNDFNILTYRNFYNGGGVAVGDINNDDLPDLYFTANLTGNRLYLNKGDFVFEDITEQAGVAGTKAWSTGATMADVNNDGLLDIYVSNSGDISGDNKENELFINNGDLTFTEKAAELGLNNKGYSTQASFFDYDLDGDLDCYLLNNSFKDPSKIELYRSMRDKPDELGGDKLYRNDGGKFTDVTQAAGVYSSEIGFGLGAAIGDVNHDFYPDIYVSNDFWERDYLYINQGDGTFSEELIDRIDFCSISSMGGDIADLNNDGHPEIISTDMLAADNYRLKAMSAFDPYHLEDIKYRANYHYQIGQNCLHRNDGQGNFQEVGMLSGVAATDWSWGALVFDFENDGQKDLFVSNGIQRDLMYMDFRDFLANNDVYRKIAKNESVDFSALISQMPSNPVSNYAFSNQGQLQFQDRAKQLGLGQPSFSNGAAYADLDDDGDMDLVINNVNSPAFIYQNEAEKVGHHFLKLKFKGEDSNPFGIGAQVNITTAAGKQTRQNFNSRGFQSSVEPELVFGLGQQSTIERLEVVWPDQQSQVLENVAVDQTLTLDYTKASGKASVPKSITPLYTEVSSQLLKGNTRHKENRYNDFDHEGLLLGMLSTEGPGLIKGDANGDGLEDVLMLGARNDDDKLYLQTASGNFVFKSNPVFSAKDVKAFESSCGAFFDFDRDGDQDLLLGSGGNEYEQGRKFFILRYFRNDGKGNFMVDNSNIPQVVGNFSSLEVSDIDQDGDQDLFIGGRLVPGNYGLPPRSYLMLNDNGRWVDVAPSSIAGLGMVTDACWADIDGDQDEDLIAVSDWGKVSIFKNEQGQMRITAPIENSTGWWRSIEPADLDGDGDIDFVLGNWGLNSKLKASQSRPVSMYVSDFDQNNRSEFIINWFAPLDNKAYPFPTKMEITQQLPFLRKKILKYETYAKETFETLFEPAQKEAAIPYEVTNLHTSVLWNNGGSFSLQALPLEAQIAPVFAIVADDFNADGQIDIWLGGNFYPLKPQVGRHDASRGVLLLGKGNQQFESMNYRESGIRVDGEVRDAQMLEVGGEKVLMVARNNETLQVFKRK